jgi:hypothetical protein
MCQRLQQDGQNLRGNEKHSPFLTSSAKKRNKQAHHAITGCQTLTGSIRP